jgi:hypothetical protein
MSSQRSLGFAIISVRNMKSVEILVRILLKIEPFTLKKSH